VAGDIMFAGRRLLKRPVLGLTLVFTLGLSIGVNAAVFSLVNTLLVNGLPYAGGDRLVVLNRLPGIPFQQSPAKFQEWKAQVDFLADASLYVVGGANIPGGTEPQRVRVANVSSNFFEVIGIAMRAGRSFLPGEESLGQTHVAIISEKLWDSQFGRDPSIVGRSATMNGDDYTIVGVARAGSGFPTSADVWTPTVHDYQALFRADARLEAAVVGRMKPGATMAQVDAQDRAWLRGEHLDKDLDSDHTTINGVEYPVPPLVESLKLRYIGPWKQPVLLLFAAVGLVLLIGCANVANLILADSAGRDHEFAVRRAVGMRTTRLVRQLAVEHILVGLLGGLAGLAMAASWLPYMNTYLPENWPRFAAVSIDERVAIFAVGLSVLAGAILGFAASWRFIKSHDNDGLRMGGRATESRGSRRLRELAVCIETGLAMVLLVGAGLFIQTLRNLVEVDLGFNPARVTVASLSRQSTSPEEQTASSAFCGDVVEKLRAIPGVTSAGIIDFLPAHQEYVVTQRATAVPSSLAANGAIEIITPGYFAAMGIPVLAGRDFGELDAKTAEPVAIIDQSIAHKLWPGSEPIGAQISLDGGPPARVVGIVGQVHVFGPEQVSPGGDLLGQLYRPLAQSNTPASFHFVASAGTAGKNLAVQVREAIRGRDPNQPVRMATMQEYVDQTIQRQRGITGMLGILSILGFALAIVGLYGLVSYSASSRLRELGIRMALGESSGSIFLRSISSGTRAVLPGIAAGVVMSLGASKLIQSELFGVKATDPKTIAVIAVSLVFTAALAGTLAVRRTAVGDAVKALREE
jgi:putative ABC transport system permease protein